MYCHHDTSEKGSCKRIHLPNNPRTSRWVIKWNVTTKEKADQMTAFKLVNEQIWYLDSTQTPTPYSYSQYVATIRRFHNAFALVVERRVLCVEGPAVLEDVQPAAHVRHRKPTAAERADRRPVALERRPSEGRDAARTEAVACPNG